MKKNKKRKSAPLRFPLILVGFFLIVLSFVFSLKGLVDEEPRYSAMTTQQQNQSLSQEAFIERLVPHAQTLQRGYGIFPSIIIGQAILESNWGASELSSKYNNLFGIKSFGHADFVTLDTKEFYNDQWVTIQGDFRVYQSWEESMDAHTMLFVNGVDWNRQKYEGVLTAHDYKESAKALQEAGYATDPGYADKVIHVIETYQLYQYD